MSLTPSERRLAYLSAAVNFVSILDFMMVMPLGPDFSQALGIPPAHIGYVGGTYTAAACVAGLGGSVWLDHFTRQRALLLALLGLALATGLAAWAWDYPSLIVARALAGLFGGPATSVSMAIVADGVAVERRGRAMGIVGGAFALSAVLGVPIGLELARWGSWRTPFLVVAVLILATTVLVAFCLPVVAPHGGRSPGSLGVLLRRRRSLLALALATATLFQSFMIIPNFAAWLQFNLELPRSQMGLTYLLGGAISFFGMRFAGRLVDRFGPFPVILFGTFMVSLVLWVGFVATPPLLPAMAIIPAFMAFNTTRFVANNATYSRIPDPAHRAGFMSLVAAVQHAAAAAGSFAAAAILDSTDDGALVHMQEAATVSLVIGLICPVLMFFLARDLSRLPPEESFAQGSDPEREPDEIQSSSGGMV